MRFLLDSEILKWNDRLHNSPYMVRPKMHNRSGNVDITFIQKVKNGFNSYDLVETTDPHISFRYLFSVASNREKEFWDIFDRRKGVGVGTKTSYKEKTEAMKFDEKMLIKSQLKTNHSVKEKEFVRVSYDLHGKLSEIICLITIIEDTVNFFQKIWGYSEDGREVCLLQYPIGSVCSKKNDKSSDYVVLDYEYVIQYSNQFDIKYKIAKMEWTNNSPIIKYGPVETSDENELCFSRNNRIDDILDN